MYVDEAAAKAELQRAQQAGQLESDEEVTAALETGIYTKAFQVCNNCVLSIFTATDS